MNESLIEKLKKMSRIECFYDDDDEDTTIYDYTGGNIDDAFATGKLTGEVMLAREVLSALKIEWVEKPSTPKKSGIK